MTNDVAGYLHNTADRLRRDAVHPTPVFRITVNGNDIAHLISPRLISMDLTDNRGLEADQLSLTLSDHDGLLALPPKGALLHLWLGWSDTGLVDKGSYTLDEMEHSGAPDTLSLRARSADLRKGFKTKRERSWSNKTLGDVVNDIALGNDLKPAIAPELAGLPILQLDQTNESDANLITRLGEEFDAVASVKAGCLLCLPAGGGKSVGGLTLPHITLTRADGDQHRYLQADRDSYDGVRAYFYDLNSAKKQEAIAGGGDNLKDLRHTYSDQESALRAARSEFGKIASHGRSAFLFGLPGNPVAVMVSFYFFARAALLQMMGAAAAAPLLLQARALAPIRKRPGRTEYQRGIAWRHGNGRGNVDICQPAEQHADDDVGGDDDDEAEVEPVEEGTKVERKDRKSVV